jgi:hypothetical protein
VTGGVLKNLVIVRVEQGVQVAEGTQMDFGGWGYGGVSVGWNRQGVGVAGIKQGCLSATDTHTTSNQQSWWVVLDLKSSPYSWVCFWVCINKKRLERRIFTWWLAGQHRQHHKPPEVLKFQIFCFWSAGGILVNLRWILTQGRCG